jgi:hypothetical protein
MSGDAKVGRAAMTFEPVDEAMASSDTIMGVATEYPPRAAKKAQLLQRLSPEKRALFEGIVALRQKIGPVKWDVVEILRELRQDG